MNVCYCFCYCCYLICACFCDSAVPLPDCSMMCCSPAWLISRSQGEEAAKEDGVCPFTRQQVCRRSSNTKAPILAAVIVRCGLKGLQDDILLTSEALPQRDSNITTALQFPQPTFILLPAHAAADLAIVCNHQEGL